MSKFDNSSARQFFNDCYEECRGCYGPDANQCFDCKNFKVFGVSNSTDLDSKGFYCVSECPKEFPYKSSPHYIDFWNAPICTAEQRLFHYQISSETAYVLDLLFLVSMVIISIILIIATIFFKLRSKKPVAEDRTTLIEAPKPKKPVSSKLVPSSTATGAFGNVYIDSHQNVFKKENDLSEAAQKTERTKIEDKFIVDLRAYHSLKHPNIYNAKFVSLSPKVFLFSPFSNDQIIRNYARENKDNIEAKTMLLWCKQIAQAMDFLEQNHLSHGNLSAGCVVVESRDCIKIVDAGLKEMIMQHKLFNIDRHTINFHNFEWTAPETIVMGISNSKSDVFSYATTIWEILSYGKRPVICSQFLPQPDIVGIEIYRLMISCWDFMPSNRPKFSQLATEFALQERDPEYFLWMPKY